MKNIRGRTTCKHGKWLTDLWLLPVRLSTCLDFPCTILLFLHLGCLWDFWKYSPTAHVFIIGLLNGRTGSHDPCMGMLQDQCKPARESIKQFHGAIIYHFFLRT
jgi:hypothetical protein